MGILRSEQLRRGTLILPSEKARGFVDIIGHRLNMQFEDMNVVDQRRPFRRYIQRIDEVERMLRVIFDEMKLVNDVPHIKSRHDSFLERESLYKLDTVEAEVRRFYEQLLRLRANNDELSAKLIASQEEKHVMLTATTSLHSGSQTSSTLLEAPLLEPEQRSLVGAIAGVIGAVDTERFQRTIFRASRGNCFVTLEEIPEPLGGKVRVVFVIYFQGSQNTVMRDKISRICQAFQAAIYSWPATAAQAQARVRDLEIVIQDNRRVLEQFRAFLTVELDALLGLAAADGNSKVEEYRLFCAKEKSIYTVLNYFQGETTLRCDCWFPENDIPEVQEVLDQAGRQLGLRATLVLDAPIKLHELEIGHGDARETMPPTYIKKNEFTSAFQELVDTYGVPRYGEINPALFAIVSFPFIFGVMYGDVGHGTLLFLGGLWAMKNAERLKFSDSDAVKALLKARYLLTMMGFFAIYAGLMYNDFLSLGMRFFASRFEETESGVYEEAEWFNSKNQEDTGKYGPYPFGLDPAWHGATNELLYVNSMKMKLSVLIGVTQMLVGVLLKFVNAFHFRNATDFVFECIPQLVFMLSIFFYMDWLIMYKWTHPIDLDHELNGAPSIINSLIIMALGQTDKQPMYAGQEAYQKHLMVAALVTVPLMLIPKPIILWLQHKQKTTKLHATGNGTYQSLESGATAQATHEGKEHEGFNIGEIVIHQVIETIEFVLGTVSHTASYLRQWALSLAHQQLSLVFFSKILVPALISAAPFNAVWTYFAFAAFITVTGAVLLGMDVLECFLHTLRLHWVEFQSKFYKADGYAFTPFRHHVILTSA